MWLKTKTSSRLQGQSEGTMIIPNRSLLFVIPLAVTAAPLIIGPVVIAIDTGRLADGWNDIIRLPHLRREITPAQPSRDSPPVLQGRRHCKPSPVGP